MERRYAVRYEEMMAEAEVKPEAFEGVLERLKDFVWPFAASLTHAAQHEHIEEYIAGLVSNIKRKNIESIACVCGKIFWQAHDLRHSERSEESRSNAHASKILRYAQNDHSARKNGRTLACLARRAL